MHVLICGGGAIGASIAYFLSCRGVKTTVIESTALACAASEKSGGFLARDWCDGTPLAPLAQRSFALHVELNEELAADWGYRRLDTYGGYVGFPAQRSAYRLGWLSSEVTVGQALGSCDNTAQVHPGQFTKAMMCAAMAQGAELLTGRVTAIAQHHGRATGVVVADVMIEGDAVVIAMGPWSILAASSLPLPAVFGLKGHSLVFDTERGSGRSSVYRIPGTSRRRAERYSRARTARPMSAPFPARCLCRSIRHRSHRIPEQSSALKPCAPPCRLC